MLARKVTSPTLSTALGWHCLCSQAACQGRRRNLYRSFSIYELHIVIKYVDALPRSDVTCLCIVCMYGRNCSRPQWTQKAASSMCHVLRRRPCMGCMCRINSAMLMLGLATEADLASLTSICGAYCGAVSSSIHIRSARARRVCACSRGRRKRPR